MRKPGGAWHCAYMGLQIEEGGLIRFRDGLIGL